MLVQDDPPFWGGRPLSLLLRPQGHRLSRRQLPGAPEILVDLRGLRPRQLLEARDERDKTREDSPLAAAKDAYVVESAGMTVEEVVRAVLDIAERVEGPNPST